MTRKSSQRVLAALLVLVLALSLTACGREAADSGGEHGGQDGSQGGGAETVFQPLGDKVFVPEKAKPPAGAGGLDSAALTPDGETLYLTTVAMEEVSVTHNGFDFTDMRRVNRLYKAGLSGGAAAELSAYQPPVLPEGACGEVSITVQRANADGTVWVSESVWWYYYDVPPEFNPARDYPWNYQSEPQHTLVYRLLDSEGSERMRIDVSDLVEELTEDIEDPMLTYDLSIDEAGNIYVVIGGLVYVVSPDREILFVLEDEGIQGGAVVLADGTMGIRTFVDGGPSGEFGCRLRTIDLVSGDWGTDYDLTDQVYKVFAGSGRFLFLCDTGSSLYGWDLGSGEAVKLLNWAEAGLDQNRIKLMTMLPDGRMAVMIRDESGGDDALPLLYLLTAVDRAEAEITERKVLTFGVLVSPMKPLTQQRIKAFNNSNSEYVIQIRDYYEMAGGYIDVAIELLAKDAQTGNLPDILDTVNLPLTRMGAKGLLEDLWPWIDQDPDFGREDLMTHVLEVASHDGKLYQAFDKFKISALEGPVSLLQGRVGWTLADVRELYESLPEDTVLIERCTTKEQMFRRLFPEMMYDFIDWEAGTCDFEGEAFRELLAFCDRFPAEKGTDSGDKIMLMKFFTDGFWLVQDHLEGNKRYYGEDVAWIGYPTVDGSCGSTFRVDDGVAMSAACPYKEAAWAFIREWFLPSVGASAMGITSHGFHSNKHDFQTVVDYLMTPEYETLSDGTVKTDESGQPIEKPRRNAAIDGYRGPVYAMKQEELDRFLAIYEATERIEEYDGPVQSIVYELAGAYFAGDKSLEETCRLIQGRMNLYVSENSN